jgi:PKD repeat protein
MFYSYPNQEDPLTVNFVDLSIGNGEDMPNNWFWSFGDGATSTEQNPVHTYEEEGTYEVCLTINTDDSTCVDTHCQPVEVIDWNDLCEAQFYYYPAYDSLPSGSNAIQFIDISFGNPTAWDWDFGDGNTSTEQNPIHIYADTGFYNVCLSISNPEDSCFSTHCEVIYIMNDTIYDCLAWFDYTIQEGLQVDFNGMATNISDEAEFTWDFGDGTTGVGQNISHTYEENGLYPVIMTFTDSLNGCFSVYTELVQLGNEFNFEVSGYVYLEDSVAVDLADVYLLTFDTIGEQLISVAETVTGDNGYYKFEEEFGQNFIYFVQAELQPGSSEYGNYLPTYHYDALTWQEAWPVFPFPTGTSYDVMMIAAEGVESGGGEITGTVSGEVRESMGNVEIVLLDEDGNAMAYTRTDENGYFSFSDIAFGTYYVHTEMPGVVGEPMMVSLHEENDSENLNIVIKDGEALLNVNEVPRAGLQSVSEVFPNPVADQASVTIALKNASILEIAIRNNFGNAVIEQVEAYSAGVHIMTIDIRHLPEGIYFMDIVSETGLRTVKKLVKL